MNLANKKCVFSQWFLRNLSKLIIGLGLIYIVFIWINQPDLSVQRSSNYRQSTHIHPAQWTKDVNSDESRIARHFAADTLPGLMQLELVKQYKRHQTGTILFVAGKLWKERSRFFKESLLSEALVYNKVNGYELETRIIDHRSQQLYAKAISADRKEFFD
jgi:hypothetical protein